MLVQLLELGGGAIAPIAPLRDCLAIAFAVTGTGLNCLAFPVRWFKRDQAVRLERIKSICSTESFQRF